MRCGHVLIIGKERELRVIYYLIKRDSAVPWRESIRAIMRDMAIGEDEWKDRKEWGLKCDKGYR